MIGTDKLEHSDCAESSNSFVVSDAEVINWLVICDVVVPGVVACPEVSTDVVIDDVVIDEVVAAGPEVNCDEVICGTLVVSSPIVLGTGGSNLHKSFNLPATQ